MGRIVLTMGGKSIDFRANLAGEQVHSYFFSRATLLTLWFCVSWLENKYAMKGSPCFFSSTEFAKYRFLPRTQHSERARVLLNERNLHGVLVDETRPNVGKFESDAKLDTGPDRTVAKRSGCWVASALSRRALLCFRANRIFPKVGINARTKFATGASSSRGCTYAPTEIRSTTRLKPDTADPNQAHCVKASGNQTYALR